MGITIVIIGTLVLMHLLGLWTSWPFLIGVVVALILGNELWNKTFFLRQGIPGPTALPLLGNILMVRKKMYLTTLACIKQYGKVFGIYFCSRPMYVVSDLDMIKDMTVKSFSHFVNHKQFVLKSRPFDEALTALRDQHWKRVRNLLTPTFSVSKMKQMSILVNECCDNLVKNFGEAQKAEGKVKVFRLCEAFTMDGIARCAFGVQVDCQNDPNDLFIANARKLVSTSKISPMIMIAATFPFLGKLMDYMRIPVYPTAMTDFFINAIDRAIELRRQSGKSERKDFLQLMVNAEEENAKEKMEDATTNEQDLHSLVDQHHNVEFFDVKSRNKKATLTRSEIYGQALIFFFAGYETTNMALGFVAYSLATNPEVQDRLIEEVDECTPDRESVTYGNIANMPYLDCVICEVLRMYPPAVMTERECNETYTFNSYTIPRGGQVIMPVYAIHHDPDLWPNPSQFDPLRFTKENREERHPFAWMPFGAGPRNCIALRFALMEIKMAAVRLLQKYRFGTTPQTELILGDRNSKPASDIILCISERS